MSGLNRPARLNRTLLALLGLVLLAGGAFAVATYYGLLRVLDPGSALIPAPPAAPTWAYYAAAAVAVVLGLLCLRWLLAQAARKPKTSTWRLERRPEQGSTRLDAAVATQPLAEEIEAYPGVHSVRATLAGAQQSPSLFLAVGAERGADLGELRRRIEGHALPRLRQALDLGELPAAVEFRLTAKTGARAR
ncbi:alkaline shock response membrane anchor protein AmaP [Amycolatopsis nigrescens]|uniref:alkaline shock response membrane anchor protein AmaP n=1 Tax=Amycolatopsis nigrescens TaxID=381445 RepID=UPI00036E7B26|nr:alkaline shock response membrane anchor protein AmaP [Amycolatopsis nigrescens]